MTYLVIIICIFALLKNKGVIGISYIDVFAYSMEYYIGKESGLLIFESNENVYNPLDPADVEQLTKFDLNITGDQTQNNYTLNCRVWLGYNDRVIVLCNFKESLKTNESIDSKLILKTITYKTYDLEFQMLIFDVKLIKVDYNVPFLYSAIDINATDNLETIKFQLKIESFNNEQLYITNNERKVANLDNCSRESNILNCEISKANFDLIANTENFCKIGYITENGKWEAFEFAIVNINYIEYTKENIYLKLETIQEKKVDKYSFIAASTNITNLPNLKTETFNLEIISTINSTCYFIKHDKSTPLYLTCLTEDSYEGIIGEIKEANLNNIHYQYNFIIVPGSIDENINITNIETFSIIHSYPDILDFTKGDSPIEIYLGLPKEGKIGNISLNTDKGALECEDLISIKKCKVPKSHFDGKKEEYYFIHHLDSNNKYVTNYETFGVKVVLPKDNDKPENSGRIGKYSFGLLAFACLLIL